MLEVFDPGQLVTLNHPFFGWGGRYRVLRSSMETLVRIENLETGSKQYVSPERLREVQ